MECIKTYTTGVKKQFLVEKQKRMNLKGIL